MFTGALLVYLHISMVFKPASMDLYGGVDCIRMNDAPLLIKVLTLFYNAEMQFMPAYQRAPSLGQMEAFLWSLLWAKTVVPGENAPV